MSSYATSKPLEVSVVYGKGAAKTLTFVGSLVAKNILVRDKRQVAKWTKEQLLDMGPTFIKIGQFVSTRSDIFDKEMIDELKTLQDNAMPFPAAVAKDMISQELGQPYDTVFADFDDVPIASASISQVHRATLISTGEPIVIKVQRPNIRDDFDRDFGSLNTILLGASVFNNRGISDTRNLLDDSYKYLYEEVSFLNERKNLQMFQKILEGNTEIIVPRVYENLSTDRIITMEYVPSTKVNTAIVANRPLLASMLMEFFISQILNHGVIHADPHPGNVGITNDGRLVLYDFGQVTRLDELFLKSVKRLLFSVYDRDTNAVMDILLKTRAITLVNGADKQVIKAFVEQVIKYFENVDFKEFQMSMINSDFATGELPFKINPKLIMMFRSLSLLEGICKDLDPEFSYFKVIELLMSDVFLDMDYIDHRARKDFMAIFDTDNNREQREASLQYSMEEVNKKYAKRMDNAMKEYQKLLGAVVLLNLWHVDSPMGHMIQSSLLVAAVIYVFSKVK